MFSGLICWEREGRQPHAQQGAAAHALPSTPGLTLRRPMVCTHSMVHTSKTSTPYSLYTVTCEGLQPGQTEQSTVRGGAARAWRLPPEGSGQAHPRPPGAEGQVRGRPQTLATPTLGPSQIQTSTTRGSCITAAPD